MRILQYILRAWNHVSPAPTVSAHCDVPCGIYDPTSAQIAAKTVAKMVEKMQALIPPTSDATKDTVLAFHNTVSRMVATKEHHAELCKHELLILWTDYFKPEHLSLFPNLHDTFWKAAKLCSKNKQEVNAEAAHELMHAVDAIAAIFAQTQQKK
ncbi:superoxide dismutase, Ni [Candidatus Uhrbacteria bacterium]|nr:superoxide dismutase, Ni [Candidatus Uhrbacteria bacterium]